jgi:HSP20 family protein
MMPTTKKSKTRKKTPTKKTAARTKTAVKSGIESKRPGTTIESRLLEPFAEVEKMLDRFRRRDWFRTGAFELPEFPSLFDTRAPSVDVVDRAKEIVIKAEIPGIDEEDLQVSVTDRTLTIKGESRHVEETEEGDMHCREIRRGSFYRMLTLPADVDGAKAKAKCKDGMLELHLPKVRSVKKHSIKVS